MLEQGSCQHIEQLPLHIRNVFVVSSDVTADEHIYIQAALQRFVDNSLSKTINFPAETTEEEVAEIHQTIENRIMEIVVETDFTSREEEHV